jgi:hypothetical protein
MKLISMTDFVLEQEQPTYLEKEEFEDVFYKIHNYAKFLKQPLELRMFVPTDENGNVLEKPNAGMFGYDHVYNNYNKAQERVLFEGFKVKGDFWLSNGELYIDEEFCENKTIEDLIDFDVTLTLTALKQLGL